jgi:hypothetical protein
MGSVSLKIVSLFICSFPLDSVSFLYVFETLSILFEFKNAV